MRTITTGLGVLVLTGSLLVGCGGDDDAVSALRDGEAPGEDTDADGGGAVELGGEGEGGDSGGDGGDSGDGDGGDAEAFCAEAAGIEERMAALQEDTSTGAQLDEMSTTFDDLAEDAPDEIAADMEALAGAFAGLADVFERVDPADPESLQVLEEESARLEEEFGDLEAASANVERYLSEECGIDFGPQAGATEGGPQESGGESDSQESSGQDDGGNG